MRLKIYLNDDVYVVKLYNNNSLEQVIPAENIIVETDTTTISLRDLLWLYFDVMNFINKREEVKK